MFSKTSSLLYGMIVEYKHQIFNIQSFLISYVSTPATKAVDLFTYIYIYGSVNGIKIIIK